MTPSPPKTYRLRSKHHVDLGSFTAKEILKKIRKGKLTGEEEISSGTFEKWQKLASHAEFYDAFLKRLFEDQYQSPPEPVVDLSQNEFSQNESATRQGQKTNLVKEDREEGGKTHQIGDDAFKEFGATIQQSILNELFDESSLNDKSTTRKKKEFEGEAQAGFVTPLEEPASAIPLEPISELSPPPESNERAFHSPASEKAAKSETPNSYLKKLPKDKKRRLLIAGALVLMLWLLFSEGKKPAGSHITDSVAPKENPSRQVIAGEALKEERLQALLSEADGLYGLDTNVAYASALEIYHSALKLDEANPRVLGRVAMTAARLLSGTANSEALMKEIENVITRGRALDPHMSDFYRAESLQALFLKKPIEARRLSLNAIEADPSSAENHLITGEIFLQAGELSQAKVSLEDAVKIDPNHLRVRLTLAQVAFEQKDFARAHNEGLAALKINPLHPSAFLILADTQALQNQIKEARGFYETCGRLAKFSTKNMTATAFFRLGLLMEAGNDFESAKRYYRLAHYYDSLLDGLAEKVKGADVTTEGLKALALETEYDKEYFRKQGESLVKQKKLREAVLFYQAASLADPKDGLSLILLGEVIEKTAGSYQEFHRVMNLYQRAIEKSPDLSLGYIRLGLLETDQYEIESALKHLTQAQALSPNDSAPYVALGKHHYKRQDYTEALNQFLKAAKINPSDAEVNYYAGLLRLLFKKEGVKDAPKFFYQAYTLDPQNYDALAEWLKLKVLNYEKNFAVKFVRNLLEVEPNNADLYWVLGEVYAAGQESRRAISYFHKSLDIDNRSAKVRMSLGRTLEAVGDLDQAVAEFRLASLLDRRNSEGFYRAADLLFQMKRYNEADEVLKYLITITPNYPGAHRYRSLIHRVRKQKNEAIAMMKEEVQKNPHNPKYRLELAEVYMEYEQYPDAIKQLMEVTSLPSITKAPEYVFDKTRAYLLLSRCYRLQGKPESAEGPIKLALEIDGNDPELHRELGYVYYALQRDKEGVREFETYLNRNPAAKDAAAIKGLIQQMMIEE